MSLKDLTLNELYERLLNTRYCRGHSKSGMVAQYLEAIIEEITRREGERDR